MRHSLLTLAAIALYTSSLRGADEVTITEVRDGLEFKIGNELVTRYHFHEAAAKPYFWPVYAPGEIPVTRAWPMEKGAPKESTDHVHQKSLWFTHGDVIPEGVEIKQTVKGIKGIDFWSETPGHGVIACTAVGKPKNGGAQASVATHNQWRTPDNKVILDEERGITLRRLENGSRLIILDIELVASAGPVTFGDTKEGTLGVRVCDDITTKNGGHFTNAEQMIDEKGVWGRPSDWCDYVGNVNGKTVGIAIFDDPENKPRAVWHARGYGLLAANPFGREMSFPSQKGKTDLVKLAKGGRLKLRYGVLLHAGDTKDAHVAQAFDAFKNRGE